MTVTGYNIPVFDTIALSWKKVHGAKSSIWAAFAILFIIFCVFGFLLGILQKAFPTSENTLRAILSIINLFLQIGVVYLGILRARDELVSYKQMFAAYSFKMLANVFGYYVLAAIIFIIPSLLMAGVYFINATLGGSEASVFASILIILLTAAVTLITFYLSIRILFGIAFILDKGVNPIEAIKLSFRITKHNFFNLLGIYILEMAILVLGMIPLGIGIIWTVPFLIICYGVMYQRLSANI